MYDSSGCKCRIIRGKIYIGAGKLVRFRRPSERCNPAHTFHHLVVYLILILKNNPIITLVIRGYFILDHTFDHAFLCLISYIYPMRVNRHRFYLVFLQFVLTLRQFHVHIRPTCPLMGYVPLKFLDRRLANFWR